MLKETARHRFVKKLVIASILTSSIFGAGSIYYGISQSKYEEALNLRKNLRALDISLSIENTFVLNEGRPKEKGCSKANPGNCEELIERLITINNRIQDYKIFATTTLGLRSDSEAIATLTNSQKEINEFSNKYFGKKLVTEDGQDFTTVQQFIESIGTPGEKGNRRMPVSKEEIYLDSDMLTSKVKNNLTIFSGLIQQSSTSNSKNRLAASLSLLIALEILLFLCVNTIDITNNNADPSMGNEFNPKKIQSKVKPLSISILLSFMVMLTAQILLFSENKRIELSHCRETNKQDIQFLNLIQTYDKPRLANSILKKFTTSESCNDWLSTSDMIMIKKLNSLMLQSDANTKIEAQNEIARLYADAYMREDSKMSNDAKNILLFSLIANVTSMAMLSIFLRMDSADIG
jgi:hypothetical protein